MTSIEIANLEHASRSATAWLPEGYDGKTHVAALFTAVIPAIGILTAAVVMLLSVV
jgi:hypothetical protein